LVTGGTGDGGNFTGGPGIGGLFTGGTGDGGIVTGGPGIGGLLTGGTGEGGRGVVGGLVTVESGIKAIATVPVACMFLKAPVPLTIVYFIEVPLAETG
jgi:hypothetical protein